MLDLIQSVLKFDKKYFEEKGTLSLYTSNTFNFRENEGVIWESGIYSGAFIPAAIRSDIRRPA